LQENIKIKRNEAKLSFLIIFLDTITSSDFLIRLRIHRLMLINERLLKKHPFDYNIFLNIGYRGKKLSAILA